MIQGWIDIVGSDRVNAEGLHESGITQAERAIAQWIRALSKSFGATWLITALLLALPSFAECDNLDERYSNNLETIIRYIVDEIGSRDLDILDGADKSGGKGQKTDEDLGDHSHGHGITSRGFLPYHGCQYESCKAATRGAPTDDTARPLQISSDIHRSNIEMPCTG